MASKKLLKYRAARRLINRCRVMIFKAMCDPEDHDIFDNHAVYMQKSQRAKSPRLKISGGKQDRPAKMFHRVVLGRVLGRDLTKDEEVDHKDGNALHNRRDNLRLATRRQNNANIGKRKKTALIHSKYKGVSWHAISRKWRATLGCVQNGKNKQTYLGLFDNEEDAAIAYNEAIIKFQDPAFCQLNILKRSA